MSCEFHPPPPSHSHPNQPGLIANLKRCQNWFRFWQLNSLLLCGFRVNYFAFVYIILNLLCLLAKSLTFSQPARELISNPLNIIWHIFLLALDSFGAFWPELLNSKRVLQRWVVAWDTFFFDDKSNELPWNNFCIVYCDKLKKNTFFN